MNSTERKSFWEKAIVGVEDAGCYEFGIIDRELNGLTRIFATVDIPILPSSILEAIIVAEYPELDTPEYSYQFHIGINDLESNKVNSYITVYIPEKADNSDIFAIDIPDEEVQIVYDRLDDLIRRSVDERGCEGLLADCKEWARTEGVNL